MAANYEKLELLGSGSYGKAWLVKCPVKSRQAVLKEIRLDCLGDKEIAQALVEVKVLGRCRHVNIVSYCEAFVNSGCLHIVMEYADSGECSNTHITFPFYPFSALARCIVLLRVLTLMETDT